MIKVFLADDHALVLEGLRSLIESEGDMEVVGTASDGDQVLERVRALAPDVVVLDLQMPTVGGIACLQSIRAANVPAKVLILSAFYDGDTMQSALEAEADGFALKTEAPQQTLACIRQVYQGQLVFPQAAKRWLRQHRQRPSPASDLSDREAEVLTLVAQGLTNTQIAQRLQVSDNTVKFHLQNIYQKLGVSNRTEAAGIFFKLRQEGRR
ncbi:response regulator transcription factor [Candidatus Chloroploca sp. M-50]|uniref:Response regulator transcription factor n=1 Tax=Candidatus Chloroploca mongolica TaxID=2528176 RepID=A0ABS4D5J9_9CHLR|nr:response regulator transcription factor [Candidatus Chloroploca mongolica]MBP1464717.1 response regulator transcription factor [Candidatus Chloroploca mongolica]NCC34593.1 response regulator transcription factor [Chloroflexia bacterium]